jgi:hypothetical protein
MPEYHYRFFCKTCGEKLVWEGGDRDNFYIEPCQTCLKEAAQPSVQSDGARPRCKVCGTREHHTDANGLIIPNPHRQEEK